MSDNITSLRRKINSAGELQSVVRTMKALAAASIGQYDSSVLALADYSRAVELGLKACLRGSQNISPVEGPGKQHKVHVVVFGSDQGLVGQFNDIVADYAVKTLAALTGQPEVWCVGARVHAILADAGMPLLKVFDVPNSVNSISSLVGKILIENESRHNPDEFAELYLFYNHRTSASTYTAVSVRLLPLDEEWRLKIVELSWPTKKLPEIIGSGKQTLEAFICEYLFVSLFRACAESLASENASRLSAMQRADKNIDDLLQHLRKKFHRTRQSGIDEELFDVIAGFESMRL